ncbi:hypothetical protein HPB52_015663 [Rhipicephalus sanguineus]|uniref:Uncharacterized protein n=1 Tax=Rhipicephalus sanguineus TaxID=34632 RepID=A0A9D4PWQ6_RHISA|nr:hypothetical protein HPB52_015663 [Rhipicephalus sanguineus]
MGDQDPIQQLGPGRPHHCASDASDHFGPSVVHIDTSDCSSTEDMASDSDFTVVSSRRLKRKIRRTSPTGRQAPKKASSVRSYTISYVPTSTTDILNSLNRQSLSEYFELVAPGQVAEIRINARKNILSVEVTTKSILDTLKAIVQLGNIPVRAFSAYDKETTTGVIYDVDEDITDSSLEKLLSSSSPIVGFHRFGRHDIVPHTSNDYVSLTITHKRRTFSVIGGYIHPSAKIDCSHLKTVLQAAQSPHINDDTEERNPRQTSPSVAELKDTFYGISTRLTGSGEGHSADLSTQRNLYLISGGWYEVRRQYPNKVNHSEPWLYIKGMDVSVFALVKATLVTLTFRDANWKKKKKEQQLRQPAADVPERVAQTAILLLPSVPGFPSRRRLTGRHDVLPPYGGYTSGCGCLRSNTRMLQARQREPVEADA